MPELGAGDPSRRPSRGADSVAADPREARLPKGSLPAEHGRELEPGTVIFTDLHLAPLGDARTERFEQDCAALTVAPRVVVLGDLFDVWVGPKQAELAGSRRVLDALRRLTDRGVQVDVIPGNRDTLLAARFEACTGATLWREGFVATCGPGGPRIALVHGDALCTLDTGYQRLRWLLRARGVRWVSRMAPLWLARRIGGRLRAESEARKPFKLEAARSIRRPAVRALGEAARADIVVCGHAHVHRDEDLAGIRWIVVAAWRESTHDRLVVTQDGGLDVSSL